MTDLPSLANAVPTRLGVSLSVIDDELVLHVHPQPSTCRHGVTRVSVLSFIVDAVAGMVIDRDPEYWSFTSDLSLRMRPVPAPPRIDARQRIVRQGRRSVTSDVSLVDELGELVAFGAIGFARVPRREGDPEKPVVDLEQAAAVWRTLPTITEPIREAAGIQLVDAATGVVEIVVTDEVVNPAGSLQGAMVALVAEAAVEELVSHRLGIPMVVTDLDIRYLAQARDGVVHTRTEVLGDAADAPVKVELIHQSGRLLTHVLARAQALPT